MRSRTAPGSAATSNPATVAEPLVGAINVHSIRHRGRLAGAVGAEEPVDLAGGDVEVDTVDRGHLTVLTYERSRSNRGTHVRFPCGFGPVPVRCGPYCEVGRRHLVSSGGRIIMRTVERSVRTLGRTLSKGSDVATLCNSSFRRPSFRRAGRVGVGAPVEQTPWGVGCGVGSRSDSSPPAPTQLRTRRRARRPAPSPRRTPSSSSSSTATRSMSRSTETPSGCG